MTPEPIHKILLSSKYGRFGDTMDKQKSLNKVEQTVAELNKLIPIAADSDKADELGRHCLNLMALLIQIRAEIRKA